jgi:5-methylcytosine-specific restriction endonuclease McrA
MSDDDSTPPDGDDAIARRMAVKAAAARRRYAENREKLRARQQADRAANPERHRAYNLKSSAKRKDKSAEWQKAARAAHPEKFAAKQKRWRDKNPDYHAEYRVEYADRQRELGAKWVREHPEHVRANNHRRLARLRGAEGVFTPADTDAIRERQQDRCAACGDPLCGGGEIDHIVPLSRGGSNWPSNLQWLCRFCNRSKGPLTMDEFNLLRGGRRR